MPWYYCYRRDHFEAGKLNDAVAALVVVVHTFVGSDVASVRSERPVVAP